MSRSVLRRPDAQASADLIAQAHEWATPDLPSPAPEDYGWTAAHITAAARVACSRVRLSPHTARETDLVGLAVSGVGLHLAQYPDSGWSEAVAAGQRELWDTATRVIEESGWSASRGEEKPRFFTYWLTDYDGPGHPDRCLSDMTLQSVLDSLPDRHVETLLFAAFTDSLQDAADAAGVIRHTFNCRLQAARRAALALWFDGETPPPLRRLPINRRGRDRVCPQGHLIAADNIAAERREGRVVERCATCRREQKTSVSTEKGPHDD